MVTTVVVVLICCRRYKNNASETASSFRDGWFCTGDIVRVDEDGFFWLTDRKKELIKYKGYASHTYFDL